MRVHLDGRPWYREPWPWLLMTGPVLVIVAGLLTTWLAIKSSDGLVEDDYYKEGLAVNQRLQRDHKAEALGLRADVMLSGSQMRILVTAPDTANLPPTLKVRLIHPTRAGHDQSVVLRSEGQGMYGGQLTTEISGRWVVTLEEPSGSWRLQGEWLTDTREPLRLGAGEGVSKINQTVGR